MPRPRIYFDLDLMYPWTPGIYYGLIHSMEAQDWDLKFVSYHREHLINIDELLFAPGNAPAVGGVVTGFVERALLCQRKGIPYVCLTSTSSSIEHDHLNTVITDHRKMGFLAAEELIHKGYKRLGLVCYEKNTRHPMLEKAIGFNTCISESQNEIEQFELKELKAEHVWLSSEYEQYLVNWLKKQEPPFALAGGNVELAWGVWKCVCEAGFKIPDEVGIIAIGNDPILLTQSLPTLSGIEENSELLGKLAARTIAGQLNGRRDCGCTHVAPIGIVNRASTNLLLNEDPLVQQALKYIHEHLDQSESIELLCRKLNTSRATLLRRFQMYRGHSPSEEIRKMRLKKACGLIQRSDTSFSEIALDCGFGHPSALSRAIKDETGMSPTTLRKRTWI